jgi:hypothetical protein
MKSFALILALTPSFAFALGENCANKVNIAATAKYAADKNSNIKNVDVVYVQRGGESEGIANNYGSAYAVVTLNWAADRAAYYQVSYRQIGNTDDCNVTETEAAANTLSADEQAAVGLKLTIRDASYESEGSSEWSIALPNKSNSKSFSEANVREMFPATTAETSVSIWSKKASQEFFADDDNSPADKHSRSYKRTYEYLEKNFADYRIVRIGDEGEDANDQT